MLLNMHLRSEHVANNSTLSVFFWEPFDFEICNNYPNYRYIWAVFSMLCFVVGFPASIVILWEMFKTHRRGSPFTPNNFFILNISIMDAVFLISIPPGILNHFICKIWEVEASWNGIYSLNITGRPLLMACVCLDSYMAVVHPIIYHKKKSLTPRIIMAAIVWAWTFATGIVYFLFYKLYFSPFSTVAFMVAIVIIAFCDSVILFVLLKPDPFRKNIHPQKQRALQTLVNSLVITLLSYLPPVLLITIGGHLISCPSAFMCVIGIPITMSSTFGSAVMPILHLNNNEKFDRLRFGCCRKS